MFKKHLFLYLLFFLTSSSIVAQDNPLGNWFIYFGNQKINNRWNIQSDFQYRLNQVPGQKSQLLIRGGLGYNLSENNHNVLLGIAYVNTDFTESMINSPALNEKRLYQQYLYKHQLNDVFVTHRGRFEERFFPSQFGLRARYFISLQKSLNAKLLNKNSIYASIYNELFVDVKQNKFDRNRFYTGLGYAINKDIRIETGYLIQAQKNMTVGQLQFVVYNNLSF
jgi:hypothetical protein